MKTKYLALVVAVLAVVGIIATSAGSARAQAVLPIGMDNLTPNSAQAGFWQRIPANQGGPCVAPTLDGSAPDTWHYGQPTTNLQGSPVCNYNNAARNFGSLLTPAFTSATVPNLHFNSFLDVEPGSGYDIADVQLSVDGGTFSRILLINKARMNLWDTYDTGLTACAGHSCQLKFFFDTVDSTSNNTRGWYLANFSLVGSPPMPTTTPTHPAPSTATPTNTPTPTSTPTELGISTTVNDCVGGSVYILNSGGASRVVTTTVTFDGASIVNRTDTIAAMGNLSVSWSWPVIGGAHTASINIWRDNSVNIHHDDLTVFCQPTATPSPTSTPSPTRTPTATATPIPAAAFLSLTGYLPYSAVSPGTDFLVPFLLANDGGATATNVRVVTSWQLTSGLGLPVSASVAQNSKIKRTGTGTPGQVTIYLDDLAPGDWVGYFLNFQIGADAPLGETFRTVAQAQTDTYQTDTSQATWVGQVLIAPNQFRSYLPLTTR